MNNEPMIINTDPELRDIIDQARAQAQQSGAPIVVVVYNDNRTITADGYNVSIGSSGAVGHNTGSRPLNAPSISTRRPLPAAVSQPERVISELEAAIQIILKRTDARTRNLASHNNDSAIERIQDVTGIADRALVVRAIKEIG